MTASRRLQLAAEASGTIGIALRRWRRQTEASDFGQPTAATTRWRGSPPPPARARISNWRRPMPRVISVFLPTLSTDRVRRKAGDTAPPPDTPLILVGRDGRRRVVLPADAAAQATGLRVGMPASKAQALVQGLVIQDADPKGDSE